MGKEPLRKDKTCLNCNYTVKERFCPNCGQENTETRKSFYHIFSHFFKDFTHYVENYVIKILSCRLRTQDPNHQVIG